VDLAAAAGVAAALLHAALLLRARRPAPPAAGRGRGSLPLLRRGLPEEPRALPLLRRPAARVARGHEYSKRVEGGAC
jgi:hypothetical protein